MVLSLLGSLGFLWGLSSLHLVRDPVRNSLVFVVGVEIINGGKVSKNSLQYMVSVQNNKKHFCGGFLISPQYVLTAAHCMTVVLGDHNISPQKNLKRYDVIHKFIPKTFKNVEMGNDIMLLKISSKAVLGEKVKTVKIPDLHYRVESNTQCLVAGWGSTKQHKDVNYLLALNVSTVDIHNCKKAWKKKPKQKKSITKLPPNIICAGGYKQNGGVCLGDSGGPLVCNSMAVGIVSFCRICKYPDVPNIFTDISKYAHWIKAIKKKKET
uniref:Peptidase S1 domain-containing protein n=1 Tax=Cyprinus carpio TaxID=7962 RepID=A0A8C2AFG7_CYPCA